MSEIVIFGGQREYDAQRAEFELKIKGFVYVPPEPKPKQPKTPKPVKIPKRPRGGYR